MKSNIILMLVLSMIVGCHQPDELMAVLPGSWEVTDSGGATTGCVVYSADKGRNLVRLYLVVDDSGLTQQLFGRWYPFRGLRLLNHVGIAVDPMGNEIPREEVRLSSRLHYTLSDVQQDSFTMRDDSGDKFKSLRVENCDVFIGD